MKSLMNTLKYLFFIMIVGIFFLIAWECIIKIFKNYDKDTLFKKSLIFTCCHLSILFTFLIGGFIIHNWSKEFGGLCFKIFIWGTFFSIVFFMIGITIRIIQKIILSFFYSS
jgi:hypothetical protein